MNKWFILILPPALCGTILFSVARAVEIPSPPIPPYLEELPTKASWTITYTDKRKPIIPIAEEKTTPLSSLSSVPKELKIIKSDSRYRALTVMNDGKAIEMWKVGSYTLTEFPGRTSIFVRDLKRGAVLATVPTIKDPQQSLDFPEFYWLSLQSYVDLVTYSGKKCYHYSMEEELPPHPPSMKLKPKVLNAWVDAETKLPVATDNGEILKTYTYNSPDFTMPVLPDRFVKALHDYQAAADTSKYRLKIN